MTDSPASDGYPRRIQALRRKLPGLGVDALLVLIQENRRYLTAFTGDDGQFDESAGVLLVSEDRILLATDARYVTQAEQETFGIEVVRYPKGWAYDLPEILGKTSLRRIGFESARMSVLLFNRLNAQLREAGLDVELVPMDGVVEALRERKDDHELEKLRKAVAVAESAFEAVLPTLSVGMTEADLAWSLERHLRRNGAQGPAFPTIVAAGPNAAMPHAVPGSREIRAGEPILFDWGARFDGYRSDMSRTVVLGEPDLRFEKVFTVVQDALWKAVDAIAPGKSGREVDAVAREHIDGTEFTGRFTHSLGHGTGLATHEGPKLSPSSESVLEPGMVVTVEPGIYLPGWGGVRLENLVLVTDTGADVLNRLPFTMDPLPG